MLQGIACAVGGNLIMLGIAVVVIPWDSSGLTNSLDRLWFCTLLQLVLQWMAVISICGSWWREHRAFSIGVLLGTLLSTVGQTGCLGTLALRALLV